MAELRPRRSVLYMPGANERALEKAKGIPADTLILDLEDAVAPDAKDQAREQAAKAVQAGGFGPREVNSAEEVLALVAGLEAAGAPEHTKLWAMLETPVAVLHAESIVTASPRCTVFVMGTNDLAKELHAARVPGREPLQFGLQQCLMAARLADKVILDGVYNDIKDEQGFHDECVQALQYGFDGKTLIHPSQVDPCNDVFAPSADDIDHSRRVIAAFDEAQAEGRGVVTVDGRMIENLHVEEARRILAIAAAIEELG